MGRTASPEANFVTKARLNKAVKLARVATLAGADSHDIVWFMDEHNGHIDALRLMEREAGVDRYGKSSPQTWSIVVELLVAAETLPALTGPRDALDSHVRVAQHYRRRPGRTH